MVDKLLIPNMSIRYVVPPPEGVGAAALLRGGGNEPHDCIFESRLRTRINTGIHPRTRIQNPPGNRLMNAGAAA